MIIFWRRIMGTRYMISTEDVEKLLAAGDAVKCDNVSHYALIWDEDEQTHKEGALLAVIANVGIAGWEFSCRVWDVYGDLTGKYVGPNIWKDEVDEVLNKHGIVADWC